MTESDWAVCTDPHAMLTFLQHRGDARERQLRLFAVACCRRVMHINSGEWSELVARTCEALTDGAIAPSGVVAAVVAVDAVFEVAGGIITPAEEAVLGLPLYATGSGPQMTVANAQDVCASATAAVSYKAVGNSGPEGEHRRAAALERAAQAALLREVFGSPFRSVPFAAEWRTSTVVALARGIYDERAFDRLPLLMDALMDAGCADENVLEHCRVTTGHHRGCWVVDMVLEKE